MKETRLINRLSEKNSDFGKWAILGPKTAHPHNSGSARRIFLKFYTMKRANKIFVQGKRTILGPKMT